MSRRKQSDASEISRKRLRCDDKEGEINDLGDKWSEEEKNRLLEALEKDGGKNNWRSIARQVRTKDTVQVKLFASQLRAEKQAASDQGALAPKDNSSLDEWITVTEKLKGDDDVDGTCIPQIMTIAAMEPVESTSASSSAAKAADAVAPDYSKIYTLLSRVMRGQPPPDLSPLDASVILGLLNDLETRLQSSDISSQVNFVIKKYKEVMPQEQAEQTTNTRQLWPRQAKKAVTTETDGSSEKPRTKLFSLNPLNIPVNLLNLRRRASMPDSQLQ